MAGPANFLLQQIAQGAQPRMADAAARGAQQGANMLANMQQQQTRNALSQAAPMIARGNLQGAMQSLGDAGEFEPTYKLMGDQAAATEAQRKANMPVSLYGKTFYDETRGFVPRGTTQRQVGAIGKNGTTVNVNTGDNIPLGKKGTNDTVADVLAGRTALSGTRNIMKNYDPKHLTYMGQGAAFGTRVAEKAGFGDMIPPAAKESLQKFTKFKQAVEGEFNRYRKEITGAAASVQELAALRQAMFNTDQSPTEFEAAMENYVSSLQRLDDLRIQLLQEGIDPRTPQGGSVLDARFFDAAQQGGQPGAQPQGAPGDGGFVDYTDYFNE